jgi:4-amino-4-deoxy-L-arabinose transferase-like glycosyltransferase
LGGRWLTWESIAVGLLTGLAFALRVRGIGEGLYHDELYTYAETHGRDFAGMWHVVVHGLPGASIEKTPPLYFVLAWLASKLGSPETTIRLPSILFGTATVPLVFLLGRRTVGRGAALFGAAFIALSPFAIWYGIEARAYAGVMCLSALSALVLLKALDERRARWWVAWAVVGAALLYTHYTGALVLGLEGLWALWSSREQWRSLVLAGVGAAALFAPWLPQFQTIPAEYSKLAGVVGVHDWDAFLQWLAGTPEELPSALPGTLPLILLGVAAGLGLLAAVLGRKPPWRPPGVALVALLAVGIPVVLLLYGLAGEDLFVYPRNASSALPFGALAVGWLVTRPSPPLAVAAVGLATVTLVVGAAMTIRDRFHRPDTPAVARALDDRADPRNPIVYYGPGLDPLILGGLLKVYLREPYEVVGANETGPSLRRALARAHRVPGPVSLVQFQHKHPPALAPGWEQLERHEFAGHQTLILSTYLPLSPERYRGFRLAPGRATGAVDSVSKTADGLLLGGWALTRDSHPANHILAFAGGTLVGAGVPNRPRPDVAKSQGLSTDMVGFMLVLPTLREGQRRSLRVIATAGRAGSPLPRYCAQQVRDLLGC